MKTIDNKENKQQGKRRKNEKKNCQQNLSCGYDGDVGIIPGGAGGST